MGRWVDEVGCGFGPGHGQKGKLSLHSRSVPGRGSGSTRRVEEGNGVGKGLRVRKGHIMHRLLGRERLLHRRKNMADPQCQSPGQDLT